MTTPADPEPREQYVNVKNLPMGFSRNKWAGMSSLTGQIRLLVTQQPEGLPEAVYAAVRSYDYECGLRDIPLPTIEAEAQRAPGDGGLAAAATAMADFLDEDFISYEDNHEARGGLGSFLPVESMVQLEVHHDRLRAALSAIPPAPPSAGVWVTAELLAAALCDTDGKRWTWATLESGESIESYRIRARRILRALGPSAPEGASGE